MLTAVELTLPAVSSEVMVGNSGQLQVMAIYQDGHQENVAAQSTYTTDSEGVIRIENGRIYGVGEGTAVVNVSYTDPLGNELTAEFVVRSTFFPFGAQYITTDFFANGTYNESTHTFKPGQWGQMGWSYPNGADMSAYKYLVIKLKSTASGAHLNIFTGGSIWGSNLETASFGSKKQIVVNLSTAKYTNGDLKGQALDTKNIRIVDFWGDRATIVVEDMYLTNNSDYSRQDATDVTLPTANADQPVDVHTLSGQLVRHAANSREALQGLPAGIYLVGGRKVVVSQ
jgi:hypothetical protein